MIGYAMDLLDDCLNHYYPDYMNLDTCYSGVITLVDSLLIGLVPSALIIIYMSINMKKPITKPRGKRPSEQINTL